MSRDKEFLFQLSKWSKAIERYNDAFKDAIKCAGDCQLAEYNNNSENLKVLKKRYYSIKRRVVSNSKKLQEVHLELALASIDIPNESITDETIETIFSLLTTPPEYMGLDSGLDEGTPDAFERAMYVHEIYIEHMKLIAEKIFDIFQ
jgi:hypothetical protein